MISQSRDSENPVGPETPSFEFSWSLWQVLPGLLVIAVGLTIWKWYEARFVAPGVPVAWQEFELDLVRQARRQYRDVLISVGPGLPARVAQQSAATSSPEFRQAVYLRRPVALRIKAVGGLPDDAQSWLRKTLPGLKDGGLAWLPQGDERQRRCLAAGDLTTETAVALLEDADDP